MEAILGGIYDFFVDIFFFIGDFFAGYMIYSCWLLKLYSSWLLTVFSFYSTRYSA
jgi:hypothetical protein